MTDFTPVLGAEDEGFTFELVLMEGESEPEAGEPDFLREVSLRVERVEKLMTIGLPEGVTFMLQDEAGNELKDNVKTGTCSVTVDLLYLDTGNYRLVFKKGAQQKTITFKY